MKRLLAAAAAFTVLASASAQAAVVYTDRALWLAAVGAVTTDNFEQNASGGFTNYGAAYAGAGFTVASSTTIFTVDPGFFPDFYEWNSGDVLDVEFGLTTITAGANFGFDYGNPSTALGTGSVTVDGVNYALVGQPTFNFFGVVGATGPIVVDFQGGLGIIDDFSVAGAVPEPATWAFMIGGFGLAGAALRRRARLAVA